MRVLLGVGDVHVVPHVVVWPVHIQSWGDIMNGLMVVSWQVPTFIHYHIVKCII